MLILNTEITAFLADIGYFGQNTKQPLSNFKAQKTWKYKELWELSTDPSCL